MKSSIQIIACILCYVFISFSLPSDNLSWNSAGGFFFNGLWHNCVGSVTASIDENGPTPKLNLTNFGDTGTDGVDIWTNKTKGFGFSSNEFNPFTEQTGAFMQWTQLGNENNELVPYWTEKHEVIEHDGVPQIQVSYYASGTGAEKVYLLIHDADNNLIYHDFKDHGPQYRLIIEDGVNLNIKSYVKNNVSYLQLGAAVTIIPQEGEPIVVSKNSIISLYGISYIVDENGDTIVLDTANNIIIKVEIRGGMTDGIAIRLENITLFEDQAHVHAVGGTRLVGEQNGDLLKLQEMQNGDGIRGPFRPYLKDKDMKETDKIRLSWSNMQAVSESWVTVLSAKAKFTDQGDADINLGSLMVYYDNSSDQTNLVADFTPSGLDQVMLKVYNDGELVSKVSGNQANVGGKVFPISASIWGGENSTSSWYAVDFPEDLLFNIDGNSYLGDEFRVIANLNSNFKLSKWSATFEGLSGLTITDIELKDQTAGISGNIQTEYGMPKEGITVSLSGGASGTTTTDENGNYSFADFGDGPFENIIVKPSSDLESCRNACLTVNDYIRIFDHNTTANPITSPYSLIAADTDNNGGTSNIDVAPIIPVILGNLDVYNNNPCIRFVEAAYDFPNPNQPATPSFPETILIDQLNGVVNDVNFIAIQIGDVNQCAGPDAEATSTLSIPNIELSEGGIPQTVVIPIHIENNVPIIGLQFSVEWEPLYFNFLSIKNINFPGASESNLGLDYADIGKAGFAWVDMMGTDYSGTVMELEFEILEEGAHDIIFGDGPAKEEVVDINRNVFVPNTIDGSVSCIGFDCNGFIHYGLQHTPKSFIDYEIMTVDDQSGIIVTSPDASGNQGFSIQIGEALGHGIKFKVPAIQDLNTGDYFEISYFAQIDGVPDQLAYIERHEVIETDGEKYLRIFLSKTGNDDANATICIVHLPTSTTHYFDTPLQNAILDYSPLDPGSEFTIELLNSKVRRTWIYAEESIKVIPYGGDPLIQSPEAPLMITQNDPLNTIDFYTRAELRFKGLRGTEIFEERTLLFEDELVNTAGGDAITETSQGGHLLTLKNLDDVEKDGVCVRWDDVLENEKVTDAEIHWDPLEVTDPENFALVSGAKAKINGGEEQDVGTVKVMWNPAGQYPYSISSDFSAIGLSQVKVAALLDGEILAETVQLQNELSISSSGLPAGAIWKCGDLSDGSSIYMSYLTFSEATELLIGGSVVMANELEYTLLEDETELYWFEKSLTASGVEEIVITDESITTKLLPPPMPPCDPVNTGTFSTTIMPGNTSEVDFAMEGIITHLGEYVILGLKQDAAGFYDLVLIRLDAKGDLIAPPKRLDFSFFGPYFIHSADDIHSIKFVETFNAQGQHNGYGGVVSFREFGQRKRSLLFRLDQTFNSDWQHEILNTLSMPDRFTRGLHHDSNTNEFSVVVQGGISGNSIELYKVHAWEICQSMTEILPQNQNIVVTGSTALTNFSNSNAVIAVTGMAGANHTQPFVVLIDQNSQVVNSFLIYDLDNNPATEERPFAIIQDGNAILIAGTMEKGNGASGFLLKIMPFGIGGSFSPGIVFAKEFDIPDTGNPGNEFDIITGLVVNSNSEYIMSGFTDQKNGDMNSFVLKTMTDGTTLWLNTYTGLLYDNSRAFDIELDTDGGFFIVGDQHKNGIIPDTKIWAGKSDDQGFLSDCDCYQLSSVPAIDLMPFAITEMSTVIPQQCDFGNVDLQDPFLNNVQQFCDQFITQPDTCMADFLWVPIDDCGQIQFTDSSIGSGLTFSWDFGDTNSSTMQNPIHNYASSGIYTVCLTVTEPSTGCSETACQTITVTNDMTDPIAICKSSLTILNPPNCTIILTPQDIDDGSYDDSGCISSLTLDQTQFTGCGLHQVTLTVIDCCGNSNSCTTSIDIIDDIAPSIDNCPADVLVTGVIDAMGNCTAMFPFPPLTATDCQGNILGFSYVFTGATQGTGNTNDISMEKFNEGTTTITWMVDDGCGNYEQCVHEITVLPCPCICPMIPILSCLSPLTIACDDSTDPVNTGLPTVIEDCQDLLSLTYSDVTDPLDPCDIIITREWLAVDSCQYTANCIQIIHLVDLQGPVITNCPQSITVQGTFDQNGDCNAIVNIPPLAAVDDCNNSVITYDYILNGATSGSGSNDASGIYNAGITYVDWTVTDICGNVSTCQHTVTVDTCCVPQIICPNDTIVNCCGPVDLSEVMVIDSCGLDTIICVRDDGLGLDEVFPPGTTCVTCITQHCGANLAEQRVVASDGNRDHEFGYSVAVSDDYAIIGAIKDANLNRGAVYIFKKQGIQWVELKKILPSSPPGSSGDLFGYAVDISGNFAIVGALHSNKAYVYEKNEGGPDNWGEQKILSPASSSIGFGRSVGISDDKIVVGSNGVSHIYYQNNGGASQWGLLKTIVASNGTPGDNYGNSVSISQNKIIAGASNSSGGGRAYIYYKDEGGPDNWGEKKILSPSLPAGEYGNSLVIKDQYCIVGAPFATGNVMYSGAAFIYFQNEGGVDNWGEQSQLIAPDGMSSDLFGWSVSLTNDIAFVGSPDASNQRGYKAGSGYIFERSGFTWTFTDKLVPCFGGYLGYFGKSSSISNNNLLVGAYFDDDGPPDDSANFYDFNRKSVIPDTCKFTVTVIDNPPVITYCPPDTVIDCRVPSDPINTGSPLATDDCNIILDIQYTDVEDTSHPCFTEITREWTILDTCGQMNKCYQTISLIDSIPPDIVNCPPDIVVIGVPDALGNCTAQVNLATPIANDCNPNLSYGFILSGATTGSGSNDASGIYNAGSTLVTWTVTDPCGNSSTCSHEISVDTCQTPCIPQIACPNDTIINCAGLIDLSDVIVIDSCGLDTIICMRDDGLDLAEAFPKGTTCIECISYPTFDSISMQLLLASDAQANDWFGHSLDINGTTTLIGAPGFPSSSQWGIGKAYIFSWNGNIWIEEAKLSASDGIVGDAFGYSAGLTNNSALVSAIFDDIQGNQSGSVYIFEKTGQNWSESGKLVRSNANAGDWFGNSISISGNTAIIGAVQGFLGPGKAYIFEKNGSNWNEVMEISASTASIGDGFGYNVSIDNNYAIVGAVDDDDNGFRSGSAFIFKRIGNNWVEEQQLFASDGQNSDNFGWSVAIKNDIAMVSAVNHQGGKGKVYVFHKTGNTWIETTQITPIFNPGNAFGFKISLENSVAIISSNDNDLGTNAGAAYIYERNGLNWSEKTKIYGINGAPYDAFGVGSSSQNIGFSNDHIVIGSLNDDDLGLQSGSATAFRFQSSLIQDTCKFTVTVIDNPPVITYCPPDSVIDCGITLDPIKTGSPIATDDCNMNIDIIYSDQILSPPNACPVIVEREWIAIDSCGQADTCYQLFTQIDTIAPVIMCPIDTVMYCHALTDPLYTGNASATDNCTVLPTISFTDQTDNADVCNIIITREWIAEDDCGLLDTCYQIITLIDTIPPVIICPPSVTVPCDTDISDTNNTGGVATASDNCTAVTITQVPDRNISSDPCLTIFDRKWLAIDQCGNMTSCSQIIELVDNTGPDISYCPGDIVKNVFPPLPVPCTKVDTLPLPVATDNCSPVIWSYTLSQATQGSVNNVTQPPVVTLNEGTTLVTWTAMDACGISTICEYKVTIDCIDPCMIGCPADIIQPNDPGLCGANVTVPPPVLSGDCMNYVNDYNNTPDASDFYPVGITTVTWSSTDGNPNVNCIMTIEVVDTEHPVFTQCPQVIREYICPPLTSATVSWSLGETDNCDPPYPISTSCSPAQGVFNIGTYPVTCTVTDGVGLKDVCMFNVEVIQVKPAADFSWQEIACGEIQFTNLSSTNDPGGIVSYNWDFKDGNFSNAANPSHIYNSAGSYNVELTITTDLGCTNTYQSLVSVNIPNSCSSLQNDVNAGLYIGQQSGTSCVRTIHPRQLGPCDKVNWSIFGTPNVIINPSTSTGNDPVTISGPSGSQFTIIWTVTRTLQNGTICPVVTGTRFYQLSCNKPFPALCQILDNGDFGNGLTDWDIIGDPVWNEGPGQDCSDPGIVFLSGNRDVSDVISQDISAQLPPNDEADFLLHLCLNPSDVRPPTPGSRLVVRTSNSPITDLSCEDDCEILGVIYIDHENDWPPQDPMFTKFMFNSFAIHVENDMEDDGTMDSRDIIGISSICIEVIEEQDTSTATLDLQLKYEINVFPNPVNQVLYVDFNEPTKDVLDYRLFDVWGQEIKKAQMFRNTSIYHIELQNFAAGVYILEIGNVDVGFFRKRIVKYRN